VIDQWKFMENPRFAARVDLIELISGLLLVLFMFGHMLMLSTILFGQETMNALAVFLEDFYIAQAGAVGVVFLLVIHFVTAGRKLPSRVREQTAIWRLSKHLRHTDTWLWLIQAVTGMLILLFGAIHPDDVSH
jgi:fumarate reductase subunit C